MQLSYLTGVFLLACQYWGIDRCYTEAYVVTSFKNSKICGAGTMSWHGSSYGSWVCLQGLLELWWSGGGFLFPLWKDSRDFSAETGIYKVAVGLVSLKRLVVKWWSWAIGVVAIVGCGYSCQDFVRVGGLGLPFSWEIFQNILLFLKFHWLLMN